MNFIQKAREAFKKEKTQKLMAAAPSEARLRIDATIKRLKETLINK